MREAFDFLNGKVYYLATVENGHAKVRPFGTIDLFEDKLYIQTGKTKDVYKQLTENPYAEICAFDKGKWIRVSGKMVPDERIIAKKHMLDKYPDLRDRYDENDTNTIVLYFENPKAFLYSFTEGPKELK